ncbi:MAG: type II/IV secretion system protein [Clostridia bacterium]|nr:type II/IV secretion system protein [Clostridia bacterium]
MNNDVEILKLCAKKRLFKKNQIPIIFNEFKADETAATIESFLLKKGIATEDKIWPVLGMFYNLPYTEMDMLEPDPELIDKFNTYFMRVHHCLPVVIEKGILIVAISDPRDFNVRTLFRSYYHGPMDYILVPPHQMEVFIDSISATTNTSKALEDLQNETVAEIEENDQLEAFNDTINAPAVRLVDSILREAIPMRTSDIHIEPFEHTVKVRYRVDGDLFERTTFDIEGFAAVAARVKIMAGLNIAERRSPQDGKIAMTVNGIHYDFRVSTLPTIFGEKFVIRILDKTSFNFSRESLGFTEDENALIDKMLAHPYGIILLTGPTGSGKSTTLYSFLREKNNPKVNIITVEDPVEYTMDGINQTQVNVKAKLTFAATLRSILRQDPDIIMVGEIRDEETAAIAVRAAITGHLVFSTLHTNDAPGVVNRLIDMGIASYLLSDALVGIVSQRLIKKLCPVCKKKSKSTAAEMEILKITEPIPLCHTKGCQYCNNTGYKGRVGIHEILYFSDEIKDIINKHLTVKELREYAIEHGMKTLFDSCREYVLNGTTSIEELLSLSIED